MEKKQYRLRMGEMMMEDPTYSCKLTRQVPLILLRGPPYSFSDSDSFKCGLCHNCLSSGYSLGWKDVHKSSFICQDHHNHTTSSYVHDHHLKFDQEKIRVKDDYEVDIQMIRLPILDVNSVNQLLTRLIQHLCCLKNGQNPNTTLVLVDDENENINISKFCDACTLPVLTPPYYIVDESYDFYRHKWCADLPEELKEHPMHPNHILSLFMTTPNHSSAFGHVFTCNSCNFPTNGFGFKCTECSSDNTYNICIRCASLPRSILHESHKHPLVLSQQGSSDGTRAACCSDVQNATFTCEECRFRVHGRCALLPRMIKHRYDECHPLTLLYPTPSGEDCVDPSSRPFCEICERNVSAKANEGWLYHCEDCDMFGCIKCFSMDLNMLSMIKPDPA